MITSGAVPDCISSALLHHLNTYRPLPSDYVWIVARVNKQDVRTADASLFRRYFVTDLFPAQWVGGAQYHLRAVCRLHCVELLSWGVAWHDDGRTAVSSSQRRRQGNGLCVVSGAVCDDRDGSPVANAVTDVTEDGIAGPANFEGPGLLKGLDFEIDSALEGK
eukprot:CAMPEP_0194294672 /NCGR_PEP_ID=MMETSP0169-20130528/51343_1 /TAXON_ID=218684 /ORGANISM="Corethron pennatum, Strain L29A3" /LENGTH=162 /DNA_ID=CAMNT_0039043609 /DNA_START=634 /DNA_END=1121 /DNA_ORIENTATION=-